MSKTKRHYTHPHSKHRRGPSHQEQKAKNNTQLSHARTIRKLEAGTPMPITLGHSIHHDNQFFTACYRLWQSLSLPQKVAVFVAAVAVGSVFAAAFYCLLTCEDSANSHAYQRMMTSHNVMASSNHTNSSNTSVHLISHTATSSMYPASYAPVTHAATSIQISEKKSKTKSWHSTIHALVSLDGIGLPTAVAEPMMRQSVQETYTLTSEEILSTLKHIEQDITEMLTGILGQTQGPDAHKIFGIMSKAIHEMRQGCTLQSNLHRVNQRLQALEQFRRDYNLGIYTLRNFLGELHLQRSTIVTDDNPFKIMLDHFIVNYNPQTITAAFCYDAADKRYLKSLNEQRDQLINELLYHPIFLNYLIRHPQDCYLFNQAFHAENSYQRMLKTDLSKIDLFKFLKQPIFTDKVNIINFFKNIKYLNLSLGHRDAIVFYEYLEWYYNNCIKHKNDAVETLMEIMKKEIENDDDIVKLINEFEESFAIQENDYLEVPLCNLGKDIDSQIQNLDISNFFTLKINRALQQIESIHNNAYFAGIIYATRFWQYLINPLAGKHISPEFALMMLTGGKLFDRQDNAALQYVTIQLFSYLGLQENSTVSVYDGRADNLLFSFTYREFFEFAAAQKGLHYFEVPAFRHFHYWSHYRHHNHLLLNDFCKWLAPTLEEIKKLPPSSLNLDEYIRNAVNMYHSMYQGLFLFLHMAVITLAGGISYGLYRYLNRGTTRQTQTNSQTAQEQPAAPSTKSKRHRVTKKVSRNPLPSYSIAASGHESIAIAPALPITSETEAIVTPDLIAGFNALAHWHTRQIKRANTLHGQLQSLKSQVATWREKTLKKHIKTLARILRNKGPDIQQQQNRHYLDLQRASLSENKAQLQAITLYIGELLNQTWEDQADDLPMLTEAPNINTEISDAVTAFPDSQPSAEPAVMPAPSNNTGLIADAEPFIIPAPPGDTGLISDDEPFIIPAPLSDDEDWPSLRLPAPIEATAPLSLFSISPSIWGPPQTHKGPTSWNYDKLEKTLSL